MKHINQWYAYGIVITVAAINSGCANRCKSPVAAPSATVSLSGSLVTIGMGRLDMVVDAAMGGRITTFAYDGQNALVTEGQAPVTGSTFWTSPQSDWEWPPLPVYDSLPYEVYIDRGIAQFRSGVDPKLGVQVIKTFAGSLAGHGIEVTYTLRNVSRETVTFAPWEITRVTGGITFYPHGEYRVKDDLPIVRESGMAWYEYIPEKLEPESVPKVIEDGKEGWVANANPQTGLLLVKQFPDNAAEKSAPEEAEIELYANPTQGYIEVEQQGAYESIAPGEETHWRVTWLLEPIDAVNVVVGDESLVQQARSMTSFDGGL